MANVAALSGCDRPLLDDLTLEFERAGGQFFVAGLEQERVEAAAMVDGLQRIRGNAQTHRAAERVGHEGNVEQVWQKPPLGLAVRMAHLMPNLTCFAGQLATPRHGCNSS